MISYNISFIFGVGAEETQKMQHVAIQLSHTVKECVLMLF